MKCRKSDEQMITDIEKFISIQRILALSDIPLNDCIKINGLIIDLSKENKQLKDNWIRLREWVNKQYDYYINEKDYIGGRLCFGDMKNNMQEIEGSDSEC